MRPSTNAKAQHDYPIIMTNILLIQYTVIYVQCFFKFFIIRKYLTKEIKVLFCVFDITKGVMMLPQNVIEIENIRYEYTYDAKQKKYTVCSNSGKCHCIKFEKNNTIIKDGEYTIATYMAKRKLSTNARIERILLIALHDKSLSQIKSCIPNVSQR